jgi:hypothetical protein
MLSTNQFPKRQQKNWSYQPKFSIQNFLHTFRLHKSKRLTTWEIRERTQQHHHHHQHKSYSKITLKIKIEIAFIFIQNIKLQDVRLNKKAKEKATKLIRDINPENSLTFTDIIWRYRVWIVCVVEWSSGIFYHWRQWQNGNGFVCSKKISKTYSYIFSKTVVVWFCFILWMMCFGLNYRFAPL